MFDLDHQLSIDRLSLIETLRGFCGEHGSLLHTKIYEAEWDTCSGPLAQLAARPTPDRKVTCSTQVRLRLFQYAACG